MIVAIWEGALLCGKNQLLDWSLSRLTHWSLFRSRSITPLWEFRVDRLSWYKFFVHNSLPFKENHQHDIYFRLLELKFLWPCPWVVSKALKISCQLQFSFKQMGSLSTISIKSLHAAIQSAFCSSVNVCCTKCKQTFLPPPMTIFHPVSLPMSSSSTIVWSDRRRFYSNSFRIFSMLPSIWDSRGNHSWGRLEPLPTLRETIQTSNHISASTP